MTVSIAELVAELKTLRKGRGIHAPHIADRIGPAIRALCGIAENEEAAAVRQQVTAWLMDLRDRLSSQDLRTGVNAAFGLGGGPNTQFYKDRLKWAEDELQRNTRTVRRRTDEAIQQLAELAVYRYDGGGGTHHPGSDSRWHTAEIRQALVLAEPGPDALELRRIVSEEDGLAELDLALTITAPTPAQAGTLTDAGIDVIYGGRLRQLGMESTDRIGFRLLLPRELRSGEEYEFALRHRLLGERTMEPHFVCVPRHRCDVCEVRVRFADNLRPARLERLDGVLQRDIADPNSTASPLELDASGEAHARFDRLTLHLAYGIRWTPVG